MKRELKLKNYIPIALLIGSATGIFVSGVFVLPKLFFICLVALFLTIPIAHFINK